MEEDFEIEIAEDKNDAHYAAYLSPIITPTDLPFAQDASPVLFSPSELFLSAVANNKPEEPSVNRTQEEDLDVFEDVEEKYEEENSRQKKLAELNRREIDADFEDLLHDAHIITVSSPSHKKGSLKYHNSPIADKPKKKVYFAQENFEQKRVYVPDDQIDYDDESDDSLSEAGPEIHIEESLDDIKDTDIQIEEDTAPKPQQQQQQQTTHPEPDDHLEIMEEDRYAVISRIEQEWEEVVKLREKQNYGSAQPKIGEKDILEQIITFEKALQYFSTSPHETSNALAKERVSKEAKSVSCFGTKLKKTLEQDKIFVYTIMLTNFESENETHLRILFSIYKKLLGEQLNCPLIGSHWEGIGFQGSNPATDLRAVGMLGLVQLLYFVSTHFNLANKLFIMSKDAIQEFPFCVVGLNLSAMVIELLRENKLNKYVNSNGKKKSLFDILNQVYCTLFYRFFTIWRTGKTIVAFDLVKTQMMEEAKKSIKTMCEEFENYIAMHLQEKTLLTES